MDKNLVIEKLNLVTKKLMNLDIVEVTDTSDENIYKGYFPRDFGMEYWDWPQGVGMYGLYKLDKEQKSNNFSEYIANWYKTKSKNNIIKNVNTCCPLLTLCKFDKNNEYEEMLLEWANWIYSDIYRTDEGLIQHVTSNVAGDGIIENASEVWIDTIYMTILFLNEMGVKYKNEAWLQEVDYQLLQHIKFLFNKNDGLFYHGYTFKDHNNFGEVYWCRGNSWFTSAMVDYLECRNDLDSTMSRYILNLLNNQVEALIKHQNESGLWSTVINNPTTYEEVSGSAAIVGAILKGIRLGYIDEKYLPNCDKAIESILKNISDDGIVLNVSSGTCIGQSEQHYIDIITAPMAYGQALTTIALSEYLNHIK